MPEEPKSVAPGALLRWGSWLYLGLAIAAILWLGAREGAIRLALFFDPASWPADLGAGAAAAAILLGLWHLARTLLPSARALERSLAETLGPLTAAEVVTLALLSGFSEELFFRGAVQSEWGIVPATALFAVLHMGPGKEYRIWTLFALVAGAVLGGLALWRGSLLAPALAHVAINLVGLARLRGLLPANAPSPSRGDD